MNDTVSVYINGKYYSSITKAELAALQPDSAMSSGSASFNRRREYEDYAQDTVQPYNASGPNPEFYRLYPDKAPKIFTNEEMAMLRSKA